MAKKNGAELLVEALCRGLADHVAQQVPLDELVCAGRVDRAVAARSQQQSGLLATELPNDLSVEIDGVRHGSDAEFFVPGWDRRLEYDLLGRSRTSGHEGHLFFQVTFAMGPHKHETY